MRTARRVACVPIVLLALLVGCGDDEGTESSPTSAFNPTATTAATGSPTTAVATTTAGAGGVVQNVVDGAVCSPQGARGTTAQNQAMVCTSVGGQLLWRPV